MRLNWKPEGVTTLQIDYMPPMNLGDQLYEVIIVMNDGTVYTVKPDGELSRNSLRDRESVVRARSLEQ